MMRDLGFFISEAYIGMKRSLMMILITVATIAISLVMLGIFVFLLVNINHFMSHMSSQLELKVYLKHPITSTQISSCKAKIQALPHVTKVEFRDRDESWKTFVNVHQNLALSEWMDDNPLPHSLKVKVNSHAALPDLVQTISEMTEYVDHVGYRGKIADRLAMFSRFTKISGGFLVGLLTLSALFIIVNTIRLTIIARQDEISIMQLVGATDLFIKIPFLIEGFFLGVSGSVVAVVLLKYSYGFFVAKIHSTLPYIPIVYSTWVMVGIYTFVTLCGTVIGILGAYLSVSKSLKIKR